MTRTEPLGCFAMIKRLLAASLLCTPLLAAAPAQAVSPPGTYRYTITHPQHGDIGTFQNTIRRQGDGTTVDTDIRVNVKLAFVTVHRLEADRQEVWKNGRLVSYTSKTNKNGETVNVQGRAEGDRFIIAGPGGKVEAPADVVPTTAWSIDITKADTVMASESGKIYPAKLVNSGTEMVEVNGRQVRAKHFKVAADTRYELWYDERDVLVKFTSLTDGEPVTFTLSSPAA